MRAFPGRFRKMSLIWDGIVYLAIVFLIFIILALSISESRHTSRERIIIERERLSLYAENLQMKILDPILSAADKIQSVLSLASTTRDMQGIALELKVLRDGTEDLERVWVVLEDGTLIMPLTVSMTYVDDSFWWKQAYEDKVFLSSGARSLSGTGLFDYFIVSPFRDEMNLSTIIPVVMRYFSPDGAVFFCFLEFNLTNMIDGNLRDFLASLDGSAQDIEVLVYNTAGMILETSGNLPLKTQEVLVKKDSQEYLVTDSLSIGHVFDYDDQFVSIFSRNSTLGLTFCIRVPASNVEEASRRASTFITLIGSLFLLVFLLLLYLVAHMTKSYRRFETMEAQSRFDALQSRMNPHFLFNTFDSLIGVIEEGKKAKVLEAVRSLSFILHFDLRETRHEVPVNEELTYIRHYVQLQEIRYKGQFSFSVEIDDVVPQDIRILKYCIQPVVENSFIHAVHRRKSFVNIILRLTITGDSLRILVHDDGPGSPRGQVELMRRNLRDSGERLEDGQMNTRSRHIGLRNINQRIHLLYGKRYGVNILDPTTGFSTEIKLPIVFSDSSHDVVDQTENIDFTSIM